MPTLTGLIQSATVCHRLREKKMYYEGGDAQSIQGHTLPRALVHVPREDRFLAS